MINLLFYVPLYFYEVKDWSIKKDKFLSIIDKNQFRFNGLNEFETDRHPNILDMSVNDRNVNSGWYASHFEEIFREELSQFKKETNLQHLSVNDIWTIKYTKIGQNQCPHNHRSSGYTGILYIEFDPNVHESTTFISPWNDPVCDVTQLSTIPNARPGVIYIWPSSMLHYVDPMKTDKLRMVTSFDMEVK